MTSKKKADNKPLKENASRFQSSVAMVQSQNGGKLQEEEQRGCRLDAATDLASKAGAQYAPSTC